MSYLSKIISVKKNHWNLEDSPQAIVGIEIRRLRTKLQITLQSLCIEICSPSYLCKIERNQIQANDTILREICGRVSLSKEQQEMLFHFYECLKKAASAYLKNDCETLERLVNQGKGFENYRYKILLLIYDLYRNQLFLAEESYNEIIKLIDTFQDVDLIMFSVFAAILQYKQKHYAEALDILLQFDAIYVSEDLSILIKKYTFLSAMMLGDIEVGTYYQDLIASTMKLGYYSHLDEYHYAMGLCSLRFKSCKKIEDYYPLIHTKIYKNSLMFLCAYQKKDYDTLLELSSLPLNEFCKDLLYIMNDNQMQMEIIQRTNVNKDAFDYSLSLLKYLCLRESEEKRSFILTYFENNKKTEDRYLIEFFLRELTRMNMEHPHYKSTVCLYYDFMRNYE